MSQDRELTRFAIAMRLLGAAAIVVGAGVLGAILGRVTAPDLLPPEAPDNLGQVEEAKVPDDDAPLDEALPLEVPPLYLQLGITPESQWDVLDAEAAYAAGIGLNRILIPASLLWNDDDAATTTVDAIKRLIGVNPNVEFMLQLDFNPPASWYEAHPDDRMVGTVGEILYPSPTSAPWLDACRSAFDRLHQALAAAELSPRVKGYALYGLLNGGWQRAPSADTSPANVAGFRAWLTRRYSDEAALQKAWNDPQAKFTEVSVPVEPEAPESPAVFYSTDTEQALIDYHRYAAESVGDAIGAIASHLRETAGDTVIWANYGHLLEKSRSSDGHLALGVLIDSDVDGFLSSVSMLNRGIGATGGFMGPVNSAKAHGKTWVLVDDTRTGIAWNKESGQIEQIRGLRAEDIHDVQRRNFSMAAIHGLSLVWSDPGGEGMFHDDEQWNVFGQLFDIYQSHVLSDVEPAPMSAPAETVAMEEETDSGAIVEGDPALVVARYPTLMVLVDEESQYLVRDAAGLDIALAANRDAILASGASAEFYLLDDLLDERVSPAPVYVFLNAYGLTADEVKRLHARFAEEKATAVWVYAPGYLDVTMNRTNVRDTVGMEVKVFDEPAASGSKYALGGGHWIDVDQAFGEARLMQPLFYIDEPESDELAKFQQSGKPSVAVRTMEAGWTSVFIAEPRLSPAILRELLRILEQQIYFRPGKQRFFDTAFVNDHLLAIHAEQSGERIVNLGRFYDIQDLFDDQMGWPQRESFVLNLRKGETRLLHLSPL